MSFVENYGTQEARDAAAEAARQARVAAIREQAAKGGFDRGLSVRQIRDLTGLSFQEAGALAGAASVGKTRDPRNFNAIALAEDPTAALRESTRQMVESGFFETDVHPPHMVPTLDPNKIVGNIQGPLALQATNIGRLKDPYLYLQVITPQGTRLTSTGATAEDFKRTLQRYGYGLTQDQIDALRADAEAYYDTAISPIMNGPSIDRSQQLLSVLSQMQPFDAANTGIANLLRPERIGYMTSRWDPQGQSTAARTAATPVSKNSMAIPTASAMSGSPAVSQQSVLGQPTAVAAPVFNMAAPTFQQPAAALSAFEYLNQFTPGPQQYSFQNYLTGVV